MNKGREKIRKSQKNLFREPDPEAELDKAENSFEGPIAFRNLLEDDTKSRRNMSEAAREKASEKMKANRSDTAERQSGWRNAWKNGR